MPILQANFFRCNVLQYKALQSTMLKTLLETYNVEMIILHAIFCDATHWQSYLTHWHVMLTFSANTIHCL